MSLYCPQCGKPSEDNYVFCAHCGAKLTGAASVPPEPVVQPEPAPVVQEPVVQPEPAVVPQPQEPFDPQGKTVIDDRFLLACFVKRMTNYRVVLAIILLVIGTGSLAMVATSGNFFLIFGTTPVFVVPAVLLLVSRKKVLKKVEAGDLSGYRVPPYTIEKKKTHTNGKVCYVIRSDSDQLKGFVFDCDTHCLAPELQSKCADLT